MTPDGHTDPDDDAKESATPDSDDIPVGEPTGEAQAAENREVDPPA